MAKNLKKLEKLTAGSKATEKDVEELASLIKKGIARRHDSDAILTSKEKKLVKEVKSDIKSGKKGTFIELTAPLRAAKKKIREDEVNDLIHELRKRKNQD